jgi:hypothetical protein
MDSYKEAAELGGSIGAGGALGFISATALARGAVVGICLGPCAGLVAAGVGIGAGLGCLAKKIFD